MLISINLFNILGVSQRNLRKIMLSAKAFKITPIIEGCEIILGKKIDSENCISTWKWAQSEYFENLRNTAFEYARQNYEKVFYFLIHLKFFVFIVLILRQ